MGFFDSWNVSGITTEAAKSSEPFYTLGNLIKDYEFDIPEQYLVDGAKMFLRFKNSFDNYFLRGNKSDKTDAVKFLVVITAYLRGKEGGGWQWQEVRHLSQGMYTSMQETQTEFHFFNLPKIEEATREVVNLVAMNS